MPYSIYSRDQVLNWIRGIAPTAVTSTVYVGLLTTLPTNNTGAGDAEAAWTGYARQAVTTATGWIAPSGIDSPQSISNSADLVFPAVAAGASALILGAALYSQLTGGTLYLWAPLLTSKQLSAGDVLTIPAGSFIVNA